MEKIWQSFPTQIHRKFCYSISVFLCALLFLTGCATHTKTHHETTTTTSNTTDNDNIDVSDNERETTTVEEETTTKSDSGGGIISGTFHVIGKILAFPFKMIGAALEAIF